jgi:hypothetical protein
MFPHGKAFNELPMEVTLSLGNNHVPKERELKLSQGAT